jgi:hypothetical protein
MIYHSQIMDVWDHEYCTENFTNVINKKQNNILFTTTNENKIKSIDASLIILVQKLFNYN